MSLLDKNISLDFILEMKEAFQLYDKSGDGFLNSKELGELMRSLGRNPTEEEIFHLMAEVDVDHNGKLDFSEFTVLMNEKLTEDPIKQQIKHALRVQFNREKIGLSRHEAWLELRLKSLNSLHQ